MKEDMAEAFVIIRDDRGKQLRLNGSTCLVCETKPAIKERARTLAFIAGVLARHETFEGAMSQSEGGLIAFHALKKSYETLIEKIGTGEHARKEN